MRHWTGYLPFYQRNVNVLEGTFALTAGNARGTARAVRLIEGEPVAAEPFDCNGQTAPLQSVEDDGPDVPLDSLEADLDPVLDSADESEN